jgi:predicted amidohydrolase
VAGSILIRNARIIDGLGTPSTAARDILLEKGRIARIDVAGKIAALVRT